MNVLANNFHIMLEPLNKLYSENYWHLRNYYLLYMSFQMVYYFTTDNDIHMIDNLYLQHLLTGSYPSLSKLYHYLGL